MLLVKHYEDYCIITVKTVCIIYESVCFRRIKNEALGLFQTSVFSTVDQNNLFLQMKTEKEKQTGRLERSDRVNLQNRFEFFLAANCRSEFPLLLPFNGCQEE